MLTDPLLQVRGVVKNYGALRPLRLAELTVRSDEIVTLEGPDEAAASVLVDLVTGTTLPDSGEILVSGSPTSAIADHDGWLGFLEQFGIVNPRVVLLEQLTVLQNLAVPLTLDLDPLPDIARGRAIELASAVGLDIAALDAPVATVPALARLRIRLGRAIAHGPRLLLIEHPTLGLAPEDISASAAALRAAIAARNSGALVVTRDAALASDVATRRLTWDAASGRASAREGWRRWFGAR